MHDDAIYYEDQAGWTADDWYGLWRYLNRLLLDARGLKAAEIAVLDLGRMSAETKYLAKHLLILQGRYDRYLAEYPSVLHRGGDHPLTDEPESPGWVLTRS